MPADRLRPCPPGPLTVAVLAVGLVLAQTGEPATERNREPDEGTGYWTPERMRDAQPYPMPSPDGTGSATAPSVPAGPPMSSPSGEPMSEQPK